MAAVASGGQMLMVIDSMVLVVLTELIYEHTKIKVSFLNHKDFK